MGWAKRFDIASPAHFDLARKLIRVIVNLHSLGQRRKVDLLLEEMGIKGQGTRECFFFGDSLSRDQVSGQCHVNEPGAHALNALALPILSLFNYILSCATHR